jgi:hypothetical protein
MIRCHQCGTDNLDGSEYCDECGNRLSAAASVRAVPAQPPVIPPPPSFVPPPPPSFVRENITPKPATPYTAPPAAAAPPARSTPANLVNSTAVSNQTAVSNAANLTAMVKGQTNSLHVSAAHQVPLTEEANMIRAKLIIQRGGKIGKEFPLTGDESLIGRWDADGGIFPDVDLDQDDPEAKVSRRHARIQWFKSEFTIEDLGSTNGTFVNRGARLLPGNKQTLKNGDEIIVGKTFLKFLVG